MVLLKAAKDIDNKQGVYAKLLATSHRRKFCTSVIKENKKNQDKQYHVSSSHGDKF